MSQDVSRDDFAQYWDMLEYLQENQAELKSEIAERKKFEETVSYFATLFGQSRTPAAFTQALDQSGILWEQPQDDTTVGHATFNDLKILLHRIPENEVFKVSGVYYNASAPQPGSSGKTTTSSTASATSVVESPTACLVNGTRFSFEQSKVDGLRFECASGPFSWKEHRPPGEDTQTSPSYPKTRWLKSPKPRVLTDSTNAASSV